VDLESQKELDRALERQRSLERNRHAYDFQEIRQRVILPVLREFMIDLERGGHFTRLRATSREKLRLDVQIQSAPPKRGALELVLHTEPSKVRVAYSWGWKIEQELYPLAEIDSKLVAERVLYFLRGLL
jgi:hypothetical protein